MTVTTIETQLTELIESEDSGAFVVDIKYNMGNPPKIIIKVDTDKGINLKECGKINRLVNKWILEKNQVKDTCGVEVTSPGIGAGLKLHRQYVKNKGRMLRVVYVDGRVEEGILTEVEEKHIIVKKPVSKKKKKKHMPQNEGDDIGKQIDFIDIKESKVLISF